MIFSPIFDRKSNVSIYMQLYEYIKSEITTGNLKVNTKLPSVREASSILNLSKTTIENAYAQLIAEGYIDNVSKKGHYVCINNLSIYNSNDNSNEQDKNKYSVSSEFNHINDGVDSESFDTAVWKRIFNKVMSDDSTGICNNGSIQGELMLRKEISNFVNTMRGGHTSCDQVIIGAGVQYLIGILIGIIKDSHNIVAVEVPGYQKAEFIFEDYGFDVNHIPVSDNGFDICKLKDSKSKLIYISPSHQYPLGNIMNINKRMELLDWASKENGLIIEDDYDGIIRYGGMPIPCLQGLDKSDCVIYLGSFSKMLLPSLRISFMIIPKKLLPKYSEIKKRYTQSTSKIDQIVLANFMNDGSMSKHLRKINRIYRRKNLLLTSAITAKYGQKISIINSDSGLHIVCDAKTLKSEHQINEDARMYKLLINIIYKTENNILFSLNYSGITIDSISEFADTLEKVIF